MAQRRTRGGAGAGLMDLIEEQRNPGPGTARSSIAMNDYLGNIAPTWEQERQGAIIDNADARAGAAINRQSQQAEEDFDLFGGAASNRGRALEELFRERGIAHGRGLAEMELDPYGKAGVEEKDIRKGERAQEFKAGLDTSLERERIKAFGGLGRASIAGNAAVQGRGVTGAMNLLRDQNLTDPTGAAPDTNRALDQFIRSRESSSAAPAPMGGVASADPDTGIDPQIADAVAQLKRANPRADFRTLLATAQDQWNWDDLNPNERDAIVQQLGGQGFR